VPIQHQLVFFEARPPVEREHAYIPRSKPTTTNKPDAPKRDRHGQNRGLPPPATFDFEALASGAMLSEFETAAILRVSTNTLGSWRRQGGHPLKWLALPNGFVRYTAGHIREFLASGKPRPPRSRPPATKRTPAKPAGTPTATTKIHTPAATSERRRTPRRPRAAEAAAPTEPAS
jgi:hypothetical protein